MKVFLVIGGCGSGKTWVMKQIIKKFGIDTLGKIGLFYFHRNDKITVLGKYDGTTFEGSDKLSMAVMKDCDLFKMNCSTKYVVCEGDRFTNTTFLENFKPIIIAITDDGSKGRNKRGSNQSERQIKAQDTRVKNYLSKAKHVCKDSNEALSTLLKYLR